MLVVWLVICYENVVLGLVWFDEGELVYVDLVCIEIGFIIGEVEVLDLVELVVKVYWFDVWMCFCIVVVLMLEGFGVIVIEQMCVDWFEGVFFVQFVQMVIGGQYVVGEDVFLNEIY